MSLPPLLLERLHAGELSPAEAEALRARLEGGELEELAASDAEILARLPAPAMAEAIRRKQRPARAWWMAAPLLAGALGLLFVVLPGSPEPPELVEPPLEITKIKGDPRLLVFRQDPQGQVELREGDAARPGDLLQLVSVAGEQPHALVFSVDGRGVLTEHELGPYAGGRHSLPHSYELDDAPDFERFFFVVSAEPIAAAPIHEQALELDPGEELRLPRGQQWTSITLRKED